VLDLLWGADGSNPKNPEGHVAQHHPLNADAAGPSAQRHGNHPDAAASTRQAVQRCATRMSISVAPGTPTTFAGALQPSSQVLQFCRFGGGRGGASGPTGAALASLRLPECAASRAPLPSAGGPAPPRGRGGVAALLAIWREA
jgi:hypothetical protein